MENTTFDEYLSNGKKQCAKIAFHKTSSARCACQFHLQRYVYCRLQSLTYTLSPSLSRPIHNSTTWMQKRLWLEVKHHKMSLYCTYRLLHAHFGSILNGFCWIISSSRVQNWIGIPSLVLDANLRWHTTDAAHHQHRYTSSLFIYLQHIQSEFNILILPKARVRVKP